MKEHLKDALRISGIYALVGSIWILLSDELLLVFAKNQETMKNIAMFKGWAYVFLTSFLLFMLLKRKLAMLNVARDKAIESGERVTEQMHSLSSLFDTAQMLAEKTDIKARADNVVQVCVDRLGVTFAWIGKAGKDGGVELLGQCPVDSRYARFISLCWDDDLEGGSLADRALGNCAPIIFNNPQQGPSNKDWQDQIHVLGFESLAVLPLVAKGNTFGVLALCSEKRSFFQEDRVRLFNALANLAATNLENARLLEETQRRLEHIQVLHRIDLAISGSGKEKGAFDVALDAIVSQLKVDAVAILGYKASECRLEFAAGRGFSPGVIESMIGEDVDILPRTAIREERIVHIPCLAELESNDRLNVFIKEGFVAYYAIPLSAKGRVLGVLELYSRTAFNDDEEWKEFLETLAVQTTLAFDNLEMLRTLEKSNAELIQAYDATIEALSFALDLKDSETKWHSKRVSDLTMLMARTLGLEGERLVQIRRGALLHDIGKMGIPDSVLLKPGALDDDEMAIMRKHPVYAFQMLSRIDYLRPSLDIPYAHHEKWDGSGYPRGLKGAEIPLAARIFAIVDVYDALTSNRPYRKAWTKEKALAELTSLSGKHFDPAIVEAFFALHAADPQAFDLFGNGNGSID